MENYMKNSVEIEKKYVIRLPDTEYIATLVGYTESDITQIYLESTVGRTHRIRRRIFGDAATYTETVKLRIDKMSAFEDEREIEQADFERLSEKIKKGTRPVLKKRLTFLFDSRLFEVDIYPEWKRSCIMEVELPTREEDVKLPPFIELIRDVTGDRAYSNASMSKSFPEELI